jgi:hypothetical protein
MKFKARELGVAFKVQERLIGQHVLQPPLLQSLIKLSCSPSSYKRASSGCDAHFSYVPCLLPPMLRSANFGILPNITAYSLFSTRSSGIKK